MVKSFLPLLLFQERILSEISLNREEYIGYLFYSKIGMSNREAEIKADNDAYNYFGGNIDEVRFWSTARTQSQIADYMFRSPKLNETGLVAYYTCNNGSGTTLSNVCTNSSSLNGTLTNGPTWTNTTSATFASNSMDFDGSNDFIDGALHHRRQIPMLHLRVHSLQILGIM